MNKHVYEALAPLAIIIAFLAAITLTEGCGKHNSDGPIIVAKTAQDGSVSVEIPTTKTYPRDELPAGIEAKEIAAVITLADESGHTDSILAPGPGEPVSNVPEKIVDTLGWAKYLKADSKSKPSKQDNKLYITKDGRVIAGKVAAEKIESAEQVKRSWKWLWWAIGIIIAMLAVAYSTGKLMKPIELITRIFKR